LVVCSKKASSPIFPALKFFCFFCCALVIGLLPAAAIAAPEPSQAIGELCVLPALEKTLTRYRQIDKQGGWPRIAAGPAMRLGDTDDRVALLRKRLVATDDLAADAGQGNVFDETLLQGVQKFQTRHGLADDGVVGPKTLTELNVPVSERIRQLAATLERCRPLPQLLERRHILVNIADFSLKLFDEDKLLLSMPVIVGKTYRQTPVFSGRIASLVLNPTWEVPHSIATKDILPKVQKDPGYLEQLHFRVFRDWTENSEVDPATVNWGSLSAKRFPYRIRQDAGPANALGRIKFLFPNPYDVYLHDTPSRELFRKDSRTFSSGCIRVAKPLELAIYLLKNTPLDSMEALTAAIARDKTKSILIPSPIAVHIVYMTAWVDHEGIVQFRPDIYNRNPIR